MPKEPRQTRKAERSTLAEDINADRYAKLKREQAEVDDEREAQGGFLIPNRQTQKILRAARRQIEDEDAGDDHLEVDEDLLKHVAAANIGGGGGRSGGDAADVEGDEYIEDGEDGDDEPVELEYDDHESEMTEVQDFGDLEAEYEIDEEEARLLEKFQPATGAQSRNLADIIMEKIREKEHAKKILEQGGAVGGGDDEGSELGGAKIDKRVAKVYYAIGGILKYYRSGKIPKAFKVLPHVQNWEQLLLLTKPYEWSPHATYAATRIFAAGLNERMAQRFYSAVLMPIIHDAMREAKKLHPSLYMAIRKALFKPIAFYKGFLLPLIMEGECTLREALVVASVLQKMHLPPVPTAVALVKIAQLPFSSANCVFLRVLIDKKMALPMQAIDALVIHFHKFVASHGRNDVLPVLWHQTFLSFIQRYKMDLTPAQLELMHKVCSAHFHHLITPEVRRELAAAQGKKNWLDA